MSRRRRRTRSRIPENLNNETINQETAQNTTNEGNKPTEKTNASTSTNGGENKIDETLNQNIPNNEKLDSNKETTTDKETNQNNDESKKAEPPNTPPNIGETSKRNGKTSRSKSRKAKDDKNKGEKSAEEIEVPPEYNDLNKEEYLQALKEGIPPLEEETPPPSPNNKFTNYRNPDHDSGRNLNGKNTYEEYNSSTPNVNGGYWDFFDNHIL
uniref:Uncharacterized protein n=1 Tax=Meloidogyne enterolobii TaxID=390850 RepID=A0A6V7W198_MELEN|nr:unnamed protein product [Meloidogyne enterolobii]